MLELSIQTKIFFFTVFIGLLIGFTYDIFRLLRKTFKHPDYLTQIEDFIYWLLSTFIMFYLILIKKSKNTSAPKQLNL